jgi:hypothetical protein
LVQELAFCNAGLRPVIETKSDRAITKHQPFGLLETDATVPLREPVTRFFSSDFFHQKYPFNSLFNNLKQLKI